MAKIYVSGIFHETHCFVEDNTSLSDFHHRSGDELLDTVGDSSPIGGAMEMLRDRGHDLVAGPDYRAMPGGIVDDQVLDAYWSQLLARWQDDVDAMFLVLHGAMVSETRLDVEGEILRQLRSLPGGRTIPLVAVYDLHANVSPLMAETADAMIAYRCNPHSDARDSAVRAAEILHRILTDQIATSVVHRSAGLVWTPAATGTADMPMRELESMARDFERDSDATLAVNVSAGFAFADTPDTGVSFQIVTSDRPAGERMASTLVKRAHELAAQAKPPEVSLDHALSTVRKKPIDGLTLLVEPSDNIGGGAPGDMTGLLRGLLEDAIDHAAICINDPVAAAELCQQRPGARVPVAIGGKGSRYDEGPVKLQVEVVSTSDGHFELSDKQSHLASMSGDSFEMGRCVVVRHGGISILLTSRKTPPFDLAQWTSQGIDPAAQRVVVVKAAVAHRRAYDPITSRSLTVDTPGPCRSDRSQFDYRHVPASWFC